MPELGFHIDVAQARDQHRIPRDRARAFKHRAKAREKLAKVSDSREVTLDSTYGCPVADVQIDDEHTHTMTTEELRQLYDQIKPLLESVPQTVGGLSDG